MLPSILAKQLQKNIGDYIKNIFLMTNEPFKGSVQKMVANKGSVYREHYIAVRFPFRVATEVPTCFEAIHPTYFPYIHQKKGFERLTGDDDRSTLLETTPGIYDGYLCCVGTSATMGYKENNSNIQNYAEEIFGEMFDVDAITTEDLNLRKNFHTVFFIDINFQ